MFVMCFLMAQRSMSQYVQLYLLEFSSFTTSDENLMLTGAPAADRSFTFYMHGSSWA